MRIGIDLDFTITEMPELFSIFSKALLVAGHEVHIITYRCDDGTTHDELKKLGIAHTKVHIPPNHSKLNAPEWKSKLATEYRLDVMFDDSPENLAAMPPQVKRFWLCDPEVYSLRVCIQALRNESKLPTIQ